jgi:hypothetical protein
MRMSSSRQKVGQSFLPYSPMPRRPILPPEDGVPRFSPKLEAAIRRRARQRFGRKPTPEELAAYRQILWAFATAIKSSAIQWAREKRASDERESQM